MLAITISIFYLVSTNIQNMSTNTSFERKIQSADLDTWEKGRLFEEYIINLFDNFSFEVEKWRKSQKFQVGFYEPNFGFPDLQMKFGWNRKYHFAIECKWRNKFYNGKLNWAEPEKIERYKLFQGQFRMTVFIAIGIGGAPSSPKKLFVTPLINIQDKPEVYEHELNIYKRKPHHRFYYNAVQSKLF